MRLLDLLTILAALIGFVSADAGSQRQLVSDAGEAIGWQLHRIQIMPENHAAPTMENVAVGHNPGKNVSNLTFDNIAILFFGHDIFGALMRGYDNRRIVTRGDINHRLLGRPGLEEKSVSIGVAGTYPYGKYGGDFASWCGASVYQPTCENREIAGREGQDSRLLNGDISSKLTLGGVTRDIVLGLHGPSGLRGVLNGFAGQPDLLPDKKRAKAGNQQSEHSCYGHPNGSLGRNFYCSELPHLVLIGLFGAGFFALYWGFLSADRFFDCHRDYLVFVSMLFGLGGGFIASWALVSLFMNLHRESPLSEHFVQTSSGVH